MGQGIKGFSTFGRRQDLDDLTKERLEEMFATLSKLGNNKVGLDVKQYGHFQVGAINRVAEAGSDDTLLVLTGHDILAGDIIRFNTTANSLSEREVLVAEVVDANTVRFDAILSAPLTAGDLFDILRSVTPSYNSSGALTVTGGDLAFTRDGATQNVIEDTVTPANNRPLPVKLLDVTGDINITAGDLNVQLSHTGGTADSVQIGDGTEVMAINASNEAQVADDTARTSLGNIDGKLPATLGQTTMANSLSVTVASDQSDLPVTATALPLPTGAATEVTLAALAAEDFSTETTLAAMSAKLPATLGQAASALSMSVTIASDQTDVPISASSLPLPTGAATETTLASIAAEDFATETTLATLGTETTLAAMSAKLPASLGAQTQAASLSVALASDQVLPLSSGRTPVGKLRNDYTSTNVTTGAWVQVSGGLAGAANVAEIFDSSGQTLEFGVGAPGGEVSQFYIFPGGNGKIDVSVVAATQLHVRAVSATADAGELVINFYA